MKIIMKTNKFFNLIVLATIVVTMISCSSDNGEGIKPPTPAEFKEMRSRALADITQTQTFNAEDGIDFTSDKGVHFTIGAGCIQLNGAPVTGPVQLEFVELYKRGNMLVVNKPLMGTAADETTKGPMVTGGQFYVNVTKNGVQVDGSWACPYYLEVPAENTGGLDPNMTFWTGTENENEDMEWEEGKDEQNGWVGGEMGQYSLIGHLFCWINIDILYNLLGPKVPVWVKVPEGYNNKNCSVYVVYKDQPGALAYMDVWAPKDPSKPNEKMFTEHYGLAPQGFNFYVVFVSTYYDHFVYAVKDVTVAADQIITFESSDLKIIEKNALIAVINGL